MSRGNASLLRPASADCKKRHVLFGLKSCLETLSRCGNRSHATRPHHRSQYGKETTPVSSPKCPDFLAFRPLRTRGGRASSTVERPHAKIPSILGRASSLYERSVPTLGGQRTYP